MSQQVSIVLITTAPLDPNKFLDGLSLTNSLIQNLDYTLFITLTDGKKKQAAAFITLVNSGRGDVNTCLRTGILTQRVTHFPQRDMVASLPFVCICKTFLTLQT